MEIFNKMIFGSDANEWYDKSKQFKIDWIKANTNQQSDEIINDFLTNLKKPCDCGCIDCGKNKQNVISKGNAIEVTIDNDRGLDEKPSQKNSSFGHKKPKGRKNT